MKTNNLHHIKVSGFKVPDGYFEQLESELYTQIKLSSKIETSGFKAPEDYFDTFEGRVWHEVSKEKTVKVISMFSYTKVISAIAIAAVLVLMFNAFFNTSEALNFESLETVSIENYLEDEDFSSYELAPYLNIAELQQTDFINSSLSADQLEDYLLDHAEIEDLILN